MQRAGGGKYNLFLLPKLPATTEANGGERPFARLPEDDLRFPDEALDGVRRMDDVVRYV
jgi:hypothetical protein